MADKLTITEALAEIKTLNARIAKKRQAIGGSIIRDSRLRDPMENEGGIVEWLRRERQSLADLEERIVAIRSSIQATNVATVLKVNGKQRTVAEWLNWRREVSEGQKQHLAGLSSVLQKARQDVSRFTSQIDGSKVELIVHISEKELAAEVENMETTLGELDGKLSLLNATTTVAV